MRGGGFFISLLTTQHATHPQSRGVSAVADEIELTVFTKANGILSKRISLVEGKVNSDGSACGMGHGRARRILLNGVAQLGPLIEKLESNQAIVLGTMRSDVGDEVAIAAKDELVANPRDGALARTSENFKYVPGKPAFVLFDHDTKGMPPTVKAKIEFLGGFWGALVSVVPELGNVGRVVRRSTSSGLSRADTGEKFEGSAGVHVFPIVKDGGDTERFLYTLHDRCWLNGLGWCIVGKDGKLLERSIIDKMVGKGERLVFEGAPVVEHPLVQDAATRKPEVHTGGWLDTITTCPSLSATELAAKARLRAEEDRRLDVEAKETREKYIEAEAKKLQGHRRGMSLAEAKAAIEKRVGGILTPDFILPLDDPDSVVRVGNVLDRPDMFVGLTMADPIEGVDYGRGKATIMMGGDGLPFIHTFAHGGGVYRLCYDAHAIRERIEKADDKIGVFVKLALAADIDAVEEEQLIRELKEATGIGIRAIKAKLKETRSEHNQQRGIEGFEFDKNGSLSKSQGNIRRAMELLGIGVSYDAFNDRMLIDDATVIDDAVLDKLWLTIDERYRLLPPRDFFFTVVGETARRNTFHPVCKYLDALKWDGAARLNTWLITYGGAEDTPYVRAVGVIILMAAVRRVRKPGCKFDEMLILESPQGTDKSTLLRTMTVRDEWFHDDMPLNADGKKVIEQTRGKWIIEAAEMSGLRRGDVEHLKALLSRQTDRSRLAWDRLTSERPRQFIPIGTTNDEVYLKDITGNRRFWPVKLTGIDIAALKRDRDQLWAEAAAREAAGESIRLDPKLWGDAAKEQEERAVDDPWFEMLRDAIGELNGKILGTDVWDIVGMSSERRTQDHNVRLGSAMKRLGFERKLLRFDGKPQKGYVRGTPGEQEQRIYCYQDFEGTAFTCSHLTGSEQQKAEAENKKVAANRMEEELRTKNGRRGVTPSWETPEG
jgi:predicted P-loop ATPase